MLKGWQWTEEQQKMFNQFDDTKEWYAQKAVAFLAKLSERDRQAFKFYAEDVDYEICFKLSLTDEKGVYHGKDNGYKG